jgi:F0F1-type ATP synthase assembly protein I
VWEPPPALRLIGIGWYFVLVVVGGLVGGFFLDKALDTRPLFILLGLVAGLGLGLFGGYTFLMDVLREQPAYRRNRRDDA